MSQPRHTSLSLRSQLSGLASTLTTCDPTEIVATQRLVQQLGTVRAQIEKEQVSELIPICTLALRIAETVSKDGEVGPKQALELIEDVVAQLCAAFGVERTSTTPADTTPTSTTPLGGPTKPASPPLPATAVRPLAQASGSAGLKLLSSRRLGELMVQMSMLTPAQVEQALSHQRMTGCRLGDALIQMRILPREAVDSVLRLQSARRATSTDNWGGAR